MRHAPARQQMLVDPLAHWQKNFPQLSQPKFCYLVQLASI